MATGNHGCTQAVVIGFDSPSSRTGRIVEVEPCTSCWQVGHDLANIQWFTERMLGKKVRISGYSAASFARHIADLDERSVGLMAEDSPRCTLHWAIV